ncbi:MAG: aspartate kinase [Hyphomicrobiales bacterium]
MTAVVVKLGGSHALSQRLSTLAVTIASATVPTLVVPGGGPFADVVRDTQAAIGFDDRAAHRMAILAMAQFAEALANRFGLPLVSTAKDVATATALPGASIWSPLGMALDEETLPHSWDLTSDSIAAWLAARIASSALALVKPTLPAGVASSQQAVTAGLVDPWFPVMAESFGGPVWIIGPDGGPALEALVQGRSPDRSGAVQLSTAGVAARVG